MEIAQTIQQNITQPTQTTQNFFQLLEAIESSDGDEEQQVDYIIELLVSIMGSICSVLERDTSFAQMGLKHPKFKHGGQPLPTELQHKLTQFNLVGKFKTTHIILIKTTKVNDTFRSHIISGSLRFWLHLTPWVLS